MYHTHLQKCACQQYTEKNNTMEKNNITHNQIAHAQGA